MPQNAPSATPDSSAPAAALGAPRQMPAMPALGATPITGCCRRVIATGSVASENRIAITLNNTKLPGGWLSSSSCPPASASRLTTI